MILGVLLALHEAKRTGQNPDTYLDFIIYAMIIAIIGARLYYVIFSWDFYSQHPEKIFAIREGGLAIHGGIIGGVLTAIVYSRVKKKNFWVMADTMANRLSVNPPKASLLKKLPQRPSICPKIKDGAMVSAITQKFFFFTRLYTMEIGRASCRERVSVRV